MLGNVESCAFYPRSLLRLAAVVSLLLLPRALPAKSYSFKVYSQQNGLLNQVINCLLQDKRGFLWVGTQNGLFRYDGFRFSYFGPVDGLPDDTVQSLFESKDGTLWVGTRLGIARFNGRRFDPDPILGKIELFGYSNIVSDSKGKIYVGTAKGLAVGKAGVAGAVSFQFLTRQPVHGVYIDPSQRLWFGAEGKLWRLEDGGAVAAGPESQLPKDCWDSMLVDQAGTFWIRSSERLLFREKGSLAFKNVAGIPHSPEFGPLYEMSGGRLFVPTDGGLMIHSGGRWERVGERQGLESDEVTCLLRDREGSVWVGSGGEGLQRWLGFDEWESWKSGDGLTSNIVWDIQRDASGQLWVATEAGLHAQDPHTGNFVLKAAKGVAVRSVLDDPQHESLWFAANPGGVFLMDRKTGETRRLGVREGLSNDRVDRLFWGPDRDLWAATRGGLFRGKLRGRSVHFERQDLPYSDANEAFFGSLVDSKGRIWVGGSRGMVMLEKGNWTRFSRSDGLQETGVSHLAETRDGAIWLGYMTNSGISRLTFQNGRPHFEHFTTKNGLRSNGAVFIGPDSRGGLWVGSDNGVDVYADSKWRHYGQVDGLVRDDCDALAFLAEPDGSVWIGTSGGLSHFRPPVDPRTENAPNPYITEVKAGSLTLDPNRSQDIAYRDRSLLIRFAAPTFLNESAVRFRYRMLRFDQDWVDADDRWVRYPNLPAGAYRFEVMARNARGLWSRKPAAVELRIEAPWWQTWSFRVPCAILLAGVSYLSWKSRIRYLVKKQELLEALLCQAKTSDLLKSEALAKVTKAEVRERNRNQVLELIGSHQPLKRVLDAVIDMVELDDPETLCLILIIRDRRFQQAFWRKIPSSLAKLFEGMPIHGTATCFAEAATQVRVIDGDGFTNHAIGAEYAGMLAELNLPCSRSAPIQSISAEVLGTITYFRRTPFDDKFGNLGSLENSARLAGVAIEHLSLFEQFSYRAQYDSMTALPNRAFFYDRLRQAIARTERRDGKLWVLWLDLDGFKHVNDSLGHQAGDALLTEVAKRISGCLRTEDLAARMGGDEFTVLLEGDEGFDVIAVIQKLIGAVREPVKCGEREMFVTASVGVSVYPENGREASELVKNADMAMYQAKGLGKNSYHFFVPEMADLELDRVEIEIQLKTALAGREFEVYYQPQYRLDRSLAGFEALLRWTNSKLGSVSPGRFIPIAEATGLIAPIGQWVLEEACRQMSEWADLGFENFRMAVNVSAYQFARADFPESVAQVLRKRGISPDRLELELTETAIMGDVAKSASQLCEIRNLGMDVSIDDFGTGYSSLSYLQRLPVDAIKIDRSFVQALSASPQSSLTMIQAIVNLAHDLNLRVVGEGVETEEQLRHLQQVRCDLTQGYLLDRPLTARAAMELLERQAAKPEEVLALQ